MSKDEVEQELDCVDADPRIRRELRKVVEEISTNVPGDKTKGMMYDLVHVVLEMEERIRSLEYRVCEASIPDELRRKQMAIDKREPYFNRSDTDKG
jgi:type III secretory pathway component EscU